MDNSSVIANSWLPPSYPPSPLSLGLCINALTIIWMEFQGQDEWTMTESDVQLPCLTSNAYYLQSSDRKKLCLDSRYDTTLCFPQNTGEHSTQLTCLHHHLYFHTIWSSLLLFCPCFIRILLIYVTSFIHCSNICTTDAAEGTLSSLHTVYLHSTECINNAVDTSIKLKSGFRWHWKAFLWTKGAIFRGVLHSWNLLLNTTVWRPRTWSFTSEPWCAPLQKKSGCWPGNLHPECWARKQRHF